MSVITLTTDFGTDSPYVAAMKGAILSVDPAAMMIDVSHGVPPQSVRHAALVLDQVCDHFPPGTIHLAVVDPGVGTDRALVCVEMSGQRFVGPDNGIFSRVSRRHAPQQIVTLEDQTYWSDRVSPTFHGRDIMARVAGFLSIGVAAAKLGPQRTTLHELEWPTPQVAATTITGEVLLIDAFGNAITNISAGDLAPIASQGAVQVAVAATRIQGIVRTYGERPQGTPVALVGSSGLLEIALVCGSAAQQLKLAEGDEVRIEW